MTAFSAIVRKALLPRKVHSQLLSLQRHAAPLRRMMIRPAAVNFSTSRGSEPGFEMLSEHAIANGFLDHVQSSDDRRASMAYSLSMASPKSDSLHSLLNERQRQQLADVVTKAAATKEVRAEQVFSRTDARPLPRTYDEATQPDDDRAIVVTEASPPFSVCCVNSSWEGLCGYTESEARGRSLGDLLQGKETDTMAATALVDKLLHGMEAGAILTNYAKGGKKFQNRIRVGPLCDEQGRITHFIGVLRESKVLSNFGENGGSGESEQQRAE